MLAPYCEPKLFAKLKIIQILHIDEIFYPVVRLCEMKDHTEKFSYRDCMIVPQARKKKIYLI